MRSEGEEKDHWKDQTESGIEQRDRKGQSVDLPWVSIMEDSKYIGEKKAVGKMDEEKGLKSY